MDSILIIVAGAIVGIVIGFAIAKVLEKKGASKRLEDANTQADTLLKQAKNEAESMKKEKIYQAKEKFLELKAEH